VLLMGDDKGWTGMEVERHTATTAFLVPAVVFPHDARATVVLITVRVCQLKSVDDAIFRNTEAVGVDC